MLKMKFFLILTIIGLIFWFLISGYDQQILITGLMVSFVTAIIVSKLLNFEKLNKFKISKFLYLLPWYFFEIMKAILYMIYFIFSYRIKPNIKDIRLDTKSKRIHDCIAFSITNLPGSVAISDGKKSILSHSIVFDQNYVDGVKKFEKYYMDMLGVKSDK